MQTALYFDRQGKPIQDVVNLADLLLRSDDRFVAVDDVGGYHISTIWLGVDHSFGMAPKPLIFETCVFDTALANPTLGFYDSQVIQRYATEREARIGHKQCVKKYKHVHKVTSEGGAHELPGM